MHLLSGRAGLLLGFSHSAGEGRDAGWIAKLSGGVARLDP